ncbi:MAG: DUF3326 domain-containing protein [Candidatus Melainabacteria bacterium]|nr:DUF3326 domain-containing protein [Candidatus Melainabacteria bacterium]
MQNPLARPFTAALIIPTGIGARYGGFGGDATPYLNLLAACCDCLLTHPNVANAAGFQKLPPNALYVEGYGLDQFFKGRWALRPVRQNRVGVVLDAGIEPGMRTLHENVIAAVRSVYGVCLLPTIDTAEPIQIQFQMESSGASAGIVENPDVLLQAAQAAQQAGATAIAVAVGMREPEDWANDYAQGEGVDPIGGLEAVISHTLVSLLEVPCAHAPVFPWELAEPVRDRQVDLRAAAEYITPSFLPCVLTGLHQAPQFVTQSSDLQPTDICLGDLDALVVPGNALGGIPTLAALEHHIPVIAVMENTTVLNMTPSHLLGEHVSQWIEANLLYPVRSYPEAAGMLLALKAGITLPESKE